MDVLVHRRTPDLEADSRYGVRTVALDDLLAASDFVSLHAPLTERTRHLIGEREFALMRPGVVFVNTARGELVDEVALASALASGHVAACGLDVFAAEPPGASPLLDLPRVVVSPHNGAYSDQAVDAMAAAAVDALLEGLAQPADPPHEQGASA
jgi:phosphoglycerate dehydrogenase-like enzyme